jgi:hypothetical protein
MTLRRIGLIIALAWCPSMMNTAATAQSRGTVYNQLPKPTQTKPSPQQATMQDAAARLSAQKKASEAVAKAAEQANRVRTRNQ